MSDLIKQAIRFATEAHQRIDQRRKYSGQPYAVHLDQVAKIVATVTDDGEMIAAAWLHDVVEDTPATLNDIEREFGGSIAQLVRELTDISKPGDGNRAARKTIDREHLSEASARGQTIKLADLIDNCKDITQHDARFARVYLNEMSSLLQILTKADEGLMRRARKTLAKSVAQLGKLQTKDKQPDTGQNLDGELNEHFKRQYSDIFKAQDIARPLLSFNAETPAEQVRDSLNEHNRHVATIRIDGEVTGFVTIDQLDKGGVCGTLSRPFSADQVLPGDSGFAEVIHALTRHDFCFISLLGQVQGAISRNDINKPYMRMWLFGIITLSEMRVTELVKQHFEHDAWQELLPAARLKVAQDFQQERQRLNQD